MATTTLFVEILVMGGMRTISSVQDDSNLRRRLFQITENERAEDWPAAIAALRRTHPHSIVVVEIPTVVFNCFAYALGIHNWPFYQEVRRRYRNVFADSEFVAHAIDRGLLKPNIKTEGVIIYVKDGLPWHAGLRVGERVTSKWGTGCVLSHQILEVPIDYGSDFGMYEQPSSDEVQRLFEAWAHDRHVPTDSIHRYVSRHYS